MTKTKSRDTLLTGLNVRLDGTKAKVYVEKDPGDYDRSQLRIGTRGESMEAGELYATVSKGEARRVRKALRKAGFAGLAAADRLSPGNERAQAEFRRTREAEVRKHTRNRYAESDHGDTGSRFA